MRSCCLHIVAGLALAAAPLRAQADAPPPPAPEAPPPAPVEDAAPPPPEAPPPPAPPPEQPEAPPAPPAPAPAPAEASAAPAGEPDEPTIEDRRLVAYVATGITALSLASGITFGLLAQQKFDCVSDVVACNQTRANKIVGKELLDARNDIERTAIAADISYLFAGAAALVATVSWLQGFVFTEPAEGTE